jgi:hypothetical protein
MRVRLIELHSVDARSPPTPLFDVAAYTAALERLFELMWERHCSGGHVHSAIWA